MTTQSPPPKTTEPSRSFPVRVVVASAICIGMIALTLLLWYAVDVLLIVFAGTLLAVMLSGLSLLLARYTKLSRGWSLTVVIATLIGLAVLVGWLIAPHIAQQVTQLEHQLPVAFGQLKDWLGKSSEGRLVLRAVPGGDGNAAASSGQILSRFTGLASHTLSAVLTLILVVFLGVYLAVEPDLYLRGILHLVPFDQRKHAGELLLAIGQALRGWMIGQGLDMLAIGLLTAIGLKLLGIPLASTLGLLAALANFIPNFGALLSFAPAALLALTINPHKVLYVAILFLAIQSFEGYILQPGIQRRTVSLPPALTILAQVLLGLLLGPAGVILATPLMAAAMVVVKVLYVRDTLGDCVPLQNSPAPTAAMPREHQN